MRSGDVAGSGLSIRSLPTAPQPVGCIEAHRIEVAREWLRRFQGKGIDGVVAKDRALPYQAGRRAMVKVKNERTADCVLAGFRVALDKPVVGIHHLEGHLLSPLLAERRPGFPFVALLVSGGHTQLMRVDGVGAYRLLGETQDDAAGEAFDKTATLLGLGYPGGPALARLAEGGDERRFHFPRPMAASGDLDFSFSGLKTAALLCIRALDSPDEKTRADVAASFEAAVVDVLAQKCMLALEREGLDRLVVAGGVGANAKLRERLERQATTRGAEVFFPPLRLCTDNGAMIAFAAALKLGDSSMPARPSIAANGLDGFPVYPRWDLAEAADTQSTPRR